MQSRTTSMNPRCSALVVLAVLVAMAGCAENQQPQQTSIRTDMPAGPTVSDKAVDPGSGAPLPESLQEEDRLIRAQAGVGKKGQSLNDTDPVAEPILQPARTLFHVQQKAVFDFQIPQAMNLYRAEHGRFPTSYDEFEKKILKLNRIKLPELPEGHEYEYDAEKGQLMVRLPG